MSLLTKTFFHRPVPPKLWHYTTVGGLEGILSSGRIWATEVYSTSDSSEFIHASEFITQSLQELPEQDEHQQFAKQFVIDKVQNDLEKGMLSPSYRGVFVASFSEARDLMSQWGWYGERGHGVSIALDLNKSRPPAYLQSSLTIAPCMYSEQDKYGFIQATVNQLALEVSRLSRQTKSPAWIMQAATYFSLNRPTYFSSYSSDRVKADIDKLLWNCLIFASTECLSNLLRLCSHCKHGAFSQEKEWRVSLPVRRTEIDKLVRYRGAGRPIPYIETDLFQNQLPVVEIMLGPCCEEIEQVSGILRRFKYRVPITKSWIPLRDPRKL